MRQYNRIVVVGGASPLWTPPNIGLMANCTSMQETEVLLYDINYQKAVEIADLCTRMVHRAYPDCRMKISAVERLEDALHGAEVVITCYRNGGHDTEERINAISQKYGSHQSCFTAGPGACLYVALQTPPMMALVKLMLSHCPNAYLVNCSNPLPATVMVAVKAGLNPRQVMGFCGALEWERRDLARFLDVEPERLSFNIGGTNHCTFITGVWVDGIDASALLKQKCNESPFFDLGIWGKSSTEIKLYHALGYLCPGGHPSDIFPTVHGKWYPPEEDAPTKPAQFTSDFTTILRGYANGKNVGWEPPTTRDVPFNWLDALAGDHTEQHFSINTTNLGAVPNLPDWAVPDLECHLDERGMTPIIAKPLPEVIAEVVRRHQVSFEMAARAAVEGNRQLLIEAIQLCPFGDYIENAEAIVEDARREFSDEFIF